MPSPPPPSSSKRPVLRFCIGRSDRSVAAGADSTDPPEGNKAAFDSDDDDSGVYVEGDVNSGDSEKTLVLDESSPNSPESSESSAPKDDVAAKRRNKGWCCAGAFGRCVGGGVSCRQYCWAVNCNGSQDEGKWTLLVVLLILQCCLVVAYTWKPFALVLLSAAAFGTVLLLSVRWIRIKDFVREYILVLEKPPPTPDEGGTDGGGADEEKGDGDDTNSVSNKTLSSTGTTIVASNCTPGGNLSRYRRSSHIRLSRTFAAIGQTSSSEQEV